MGGRMKRSGRYSFLSVTLSVQFGGAISFLILVDRSGNNESWICEDFDQRAKHRKAG